VYNSLHGNRTLPHAPRYVTVIYLDEPRLDAGHRPWMLALWNRRFDWLRRVPVPPRVVARKTLYKWPLSTLFRRRIKVLPAKRGHKSLLILSDSFFTVSVSHNISLEIYPQLLSYHHLISIFRTQ